MYTLVYDFLACQFQLSCYPGQAVFLCNDEGPILSWKIRAERNVQKYIHFHITDPVGTQISSAVAGTSVRAEKVVSSSSSTISSTITLMLPIDPDLVSIECYRKIVFLDYHTRSKTL